jgi:hypothetical protein
MVILLVLGDLCWAPILLAAFKRTDLKDLDRHGTLLISEPNLNNSTASLLGNLTNRYFRLIEDRSCILPYNSKAIYIGEDPAIKRIQHSLYIHAAARPIAKTHSPQSLKAMIDPLRDRLSKYREQIMKGGQRFDLYPRGLSSEAHAMANSLGSWLVGSHQLAADLVSLLKQQDQQKIAERSDSFEGLVAGAVLTLSHEDRTQVFVKEIAAEINRLLDAQGESLRLTPEKVGHKLRKLGLPTRRLSQAGNGLLLTQQTKVLLHQVAAAYLGEDSVEQCPNLHCPLCAQNQQLRKDMQDGEDLGAHCQSS